MLRVPSGRESRVDRRPGSLLARAQGGDGHAFTELVRRHDQRLRAVAYRLLDDRELMDDVLQDAYLKAFRALPAFRGESALATWLYRITYNACLDELRQRQRRGDPLPLPDGTEPPHGLSDGVDLEERVVRAGAVRAALMALAPEERAATWLVDAEGLDYRSAAEALGVREGTIASRLNRARAALRTALAELAEEVDG